MDSDRELSYHEWRQIMQQFDYRCAYCDCEPSALTPDHFIPRSKGGKSDALNLIPTCRACNLEKGDQDAAAFLARKYGSTDGLARWRKLHRYFVNLRYDTIASASKRVKS